MDKKIIKRTLPFILCIVLLVGTIILSMQNTTTSPHESNNNTINKSSRNDYNIKENEEMKAVWVPFMALEDKNGNYTEAEFKSRFDNILADSKNHGINTMVVHVRPFGDALYKSNLFPWSHILSGTQGNDPGFDPLEYMIEKTHNDNMAFHAWINPLRIQSNNTPSILCESNLYNKWKTDSDSSNDNWVLDSNGNKYFNPYYPEVRKVIIDGVKEIVENKRFNLLEALAENIAEEVLNKFDLLKGIMVRDKKPEAPVPGIYDYVGVEIKRAKDE